MHAGKLAHVGCCVLLLVGCGGDSAGDSNGGSETSSAVGSSDGGGTDGSEEGGTTADPDTSGTADATSGDTGEPGMPGDARILYSRDDVAGSEVGAWVLDIVAGDPEPPVRVLDHDVPLVQTSPDGRWRIHGNDPLHPTSVHLVDLFARPAVPAVTLDIDDGSGFISALLETIAADGTGAILRGRGNPDEDTRMFSVSLGDDGPGDPWLLELGLQAGQFPSAASYMPGNEQLAVVIRDVVADTESLVLAPADEAAPAGLVPITTTPQDIGEVGVTADGRFLAYTEEVPLDGGIAYIVDLDVMPVAPIEVVPLAENARVTGLSLSPDDRGLIARIADDITLEEIAVDAHWIAIEDGVPAPPVLLSTGATAGIVGPLRGWSPDGHWFFFVVENPFALRLVRFDAGVPSGPFELQPGETSVDTPEISPDNTYLYYSAPVDDASEGVFRVDISGAAPTEPQSVGEPVAALQHFALSADGTTVVISAAVTHDDPVEAYVVDVSQAEPSAPARVNAPLADNETVFYALLSDDGRRIVYRTTLLDLGEARGYYVDLLGAGPNGALPLADGGDISGMSIRALP